ncbi:MAG: membrane-bound O-acyltransferase family protein [Clostridia bacterium]|jgi:alginate O-acetyltransferase complex protein AlgI|nr:MAG: membrane-bound O-acyltransferase family protein [Clostridia bacterium]
MLFNSLGFAIYLPIVFILYWFVFRKLRWQNLFLLVASYVFYGWWNARFLILIALTSFFSYVSGLLIDGCRFDGGRKRQKLISALNIVLNLSILGVFKYYNFFVENLAALFHSIGLQADWVTLNILLPVGISFYTFQALSYSIDVYQKKIPACKDIVSFFAYISFFPQLVAGPIERATNLLPQFYETRKFDYAKAVDGCRQILWGFFKKMVVADNCASVVNTIWGNYENENPFTLLLGGFFFTFQIYGDFSGYSDIAIGTARLFGFNLMRNFNFPYFSRDIAEFWRRWHISLTTWFRDYIYIPLGGSRCSQAKVMRNTMIIFLVSGFWHGANWTFIVWGAYHAFLFFPLMMLKMNRKYTDVVAKGRIIPSIKEFVQMSITFMLALIGWIIFRADNIGSALDYIARMCSGSILDVNIVYGKKALLYIFLLLVVEWLQRDKQHGLQISENGLLKYSTVRWTVYVTIALFTILLAGTQAEFIYFQF